MFQTVYTETGGDHQDHNNENGREQLLALVINNLGDDIKRIIIGIDAEHAEKSLQTEINGAHKKGSFSNEKLP